MGTGPGGRHTVRAFVSSTFRDMHAERDHLNRVVFPELRSRCQKRGVEFVGLDLRWGLTEEEAQREGALKLCLDEVERCRPFFVCLLGDRYGWVPPPEEVPQELFEDVVRDGGDPWPSDWYTLDTTSVPPVYHLRREREVPGDVADALVHLWEERGLPHAGQSITAREVLHGVFGEGGAESLPESHALFYLRESGVEQQDDFPEALVPVFVEGNAERARKLDALKARIRRHGTVALDGLEALGNQILEDLWAAIEREMERPDEVPEVAIHPIDIQGPAALERRRDILQGLISVLDLTVQLGRSRMPGHRSHELREHLLLKHHHLQDLQGRIVPIILAQSVVLTRDGRILEHEWSGIGSWQA